MGATVICIYLFKNQDTLTVVIWEFGVNGGFIYNIIIELFKQYTCMNKYIGKIYGNKEIQLF